MTNNNHKFLTKIFSSQATLETMVFKFEAEWANHVKYDIKCCQLPF